MIYDYVIIGAGPVGLTLAYYLGKMNKKCILVDKNNSVGGNHRANKINDLMTHMNKNFIHLLKDMGYNFPSIYDLHLFNNLSIGEIFLFFGEFITLFFTNKFSKSISVNSYMKKNNFSEKSIDYINNICKITNTISLYQFLQLFNQISLSKKPNDKLLFKSWSDAIEKTNNVDIVLNTDATNINSDQVQTDNIINISLKIADVSTNISGKNYIFGIQSKSLFKLVSNSKLESIKFNNLYIINDQPHNNKYNIIGVESAVTNAIDLVYKLEPEFKYKMLEPDTIIEICQFLFLITFILYIFKRTLRLF
jgi:hypothetical protein